MLSDLRIRKSIADREIIIDPFPDDQQFQPASIDLKLSEQLYIYKDNAQYAHDMCGIYEIHPYIMTPYECVLASTYERIELSEKLVARVEGKSSIARKFVQVHVTAGFIDPGFRGNITLEIVNHSPFNFTLTPGMLIAQICFQRIDGRVQRPYGQKDLGSHYQDSKGTVLPK